MSLLSKVLALGGLTVLSPLLIAIAIAIKCADKGPVFFKQERVGKDGQLFTCYKFRTMRNDAEALLLHWKATNHPNWVLYEQSNFKLQDDPRVTGIGRFLRRTSFDELAQLINIAKGDMAIVGPRPLLEREVEAYGSGRYKTYCEMLPGLTGLWQVSGRSNTTFDRRAELDMEYHARRSWLLDLQIILKTVKIVFRKDGAY